MGRRKETILHRAALRNRREMVEFLLKQGGLSPKETDGNGNTPLHCAALGGHADVGQLLVDAGADLEATNNEGDRPLHLGAGAGNLAFLKFLLQVGHWVSLLGKNAKSYYRLEQHWTALVARATRHFTMRHKMQRQM